MTLLLLCFFTSPVINLRYKVSEVSGILHLLSHYWTYKVTNMEIEKQPGHLTAATAPQQCSKLQADCHRKVNFITAHLLSIVSGIPGNLKIKQIKFQ